MYDTRIRGVDFFLPSYEVGERDVRPKLTDVEKKRSIYMGGVCEVYDRFR